MSIKDKHDFPLISTYLPGDTVSNNDSDVVERWL